MEYLTSHYTTFRKTHYRKIKLLEYIAKKVELLECIVRPDLTFSICHRGVRAPSIPSSRHLFNTAIATTNRCNPATMNPADRRRGGWRGKGTGKEGAPPPVRRSAQTNPSAAVGDFVDPRLLKPPPESIPPAPGAGIPLLVRLGDVPPARATPPYPLRNNRTPAPDPPAVIYRKVCALGDVLLLDF